MKNKIKLMFILSLTLFGFGMILHNGLSIVDANEATNIYEDSVNDVKAMSMASEVESQSDSNVIDEINIDVIDEIFEFFGKEF